MQNPPYYCHLIKYLTVVFIIFLIDGCAGDYQPSHGFSFENKNLKIFYSDPLDYPSIMDAVKGCSCLFYSFEPPKENSTYDVSINGFIIKFHYGLIQRFRSAFNMMIAVLNFITQLLALHIEYIRARNIGLNW